MDFKKPFSWEEAKKRTIEKAISRAHILSGGMSPESLANPEFKIVHPDWVSQATSKQFTVMDKTIKLELEKYQKRALDRRAKYAPTRR